MKNSFGEAGYGGPQPPRGSGDHPYVFTLYALSAPKVEIGKSAGLAAFKQALEGKILATATLTGYFGRWFSPAHRGSGPAFRLLPAFFSGG